MDFDDIERDKRLKAATKFTLEHKALIQREAAHFAKRASKASLRRVTTLSGWRGRWGMRGWEVPLDYGHWKGSDSRTKTTVTVSKRGKVTDYSDGLHAVGASPSEFSQVGIRESFDRYLNKHSKE